MAKIDKGFNGTEAKKLSTLNLKIWTENALAVSNNEKQTSK